MPTSDELLQLAEACAKKLDLDGKVRHKQIAAALPEGKRALIVDLADNHARHVWLQQEGAYHLGLAVGRRLRGRT